MRSPTRESPDGELRSHHAGLGSEVPGAILLTGYLGGAVIAHMRLDDPWFRHTLFPIYVGALVWGGLMLSDRRVRELILGPTPRPSTPLLTLLDGCFPRAADRGRAERPGQGARS